jgi:ankyrin repeat protein
VTRFIIWNFVFLIAFSQVCVADINDQDQDGYSAFMRAARSGSERELRAIVAQSPRGDLVATDREHKGWSVVHLMVQRAARSVDMMGALGRILRTYRDLVNTPAADGMTPLILATQDPRNSYMIRLLLSVGANARIADPQGFSPLAHAVANGQNAETLGWLLPPRPGRDARAQALNLYRDEIQGAAATAISHGRVYALQIFLNLRALGADRLSALLFGALANRQASVAIAMLLNAGADMTLHDAGGYTVVHREAEQADGNYLETLVSHNPALLIQGTRAEAPLLPVEIAMNAARRAQDQRTRARLEQSAVYLTQALVRYVQAGRILLSTSQLRLYLAGTRLAAVAAGLQSVVRAVDEALAQLDAAAQPAPRAEQAAQPNATNNAGASAAVCKPCAMECQATQ